MRVFTLIVAVVALAVSVYSLVQTGGIKDLRRQVEGLSTQTDVAREKTAEALDRLEHLIRGK